MAVEHWNAECAGWHVCKSGSWYAALEPIAAGLTRCYAAVGVAVAAFVERCSAHWQVEKLGFLTPNEARSQHALAAAA